MCPSTDTSAEQPQFATEVLRKLLHRIDNSAPDDHEPYRVTHAWTEGTMIYVVYTAPPSARAWGLARNTTESIVDPGSWSNADEAALYYYLIDFEENQPWSSPPVATTDEIWWFGLRSEGLPARTTDISDTHLHGAPAAYRQTPPQQHARPEPRRYGNPIDETNRH